MSLRSDISFYPIYTLYSRDNRSFHRYLINNILITILYNHPPKKALNVRTRKLMQKGTAAAHGTR